MTYVISEVGKDLSARDFIDISKSVGWGVQKKYNLRKVSTALRNSFYIITVRKNGLLVGCGRVLSDDLLFTTVPDLFVRPAFQKKGIGKLIMQRIIKRFSHTTIYFGSQPGNEKFFEKLGFVKGLQSYSMNKK